MRNRLISSIAGVAFSFAATGLAFAADMPVKAPPPAPAPVPTWTGFVSNLAAAGATKRSIIQATILSLQCC
jgi:hypothetical protein